MNKTIEAFLNNETYLLAYRFNGDFAREANQEIIDYIKQLQQKEQNLIKYLEDKIKISSNDNTYVNGMHFISQNHAIYKDLLERLKSDNYENNNI